MLLKMAGIALQGLRRHRALPFAGTRRCRLSRRSAAVVRLHMPLQYISPGEVLETSWTLNVLHVR